MDFCFRFQFIVALAGIFIGILYIVVGLMVIIFILFMNFKIYSIKKEKSQTNFELESSNENSRAPTIK